MASTAPTTESQASKKKNNKKKKTAGKAKPAENAQQEEEASDGETAPPPEPEDEAPENGDAANGHAGANGKSPQPQPPQSPTEEATPPSDTSRQSQSQEGNTGDTSAKLAAMTEERDALRTEVEQLRRQLESLRESHATDTSQLRTELEESEAARDRAEDQYQTLLGRVEKIKETLGDRLKRDREELAEAKDRVEELEGQSEGLVKRAEEAEAEAERLREELHESNRELSSLRSRGNLSQQNWLKEKEDMARQLHSYKVELDRTSSAMGEWEVIAMEQKSVRDSLADKVAELEAEAGQLREAHERAASERDAQAQAVDALQRALREIQEARKRELREVVESSEEQLEAANRKAKEAARLAEEAVAAREQLSKELERMAPFEKEVKEKNLLIGKLRHEAIVLNDHLTKALKYIKKNKPEENVDRQVVTNLFLQFLALDRSDPKKFQVLQVISGILSWSEEQKEQAGLARPGTSSSSLRLPSAPFHRTPSTPSLNTEFFSESSTTPTNKESLAELWAGFLERSVDEAGTGVAGMGLGSRKGSMSSNATGTTRPDTRGA
ncbi:hypothetical protein PpBr36_01821 [Pyricularia pennisetigena]|uniref:hypothetical protein n=1 Tax=Pyricularia pennisetigena TaxID=1578925 RepID=UPI00114FFF56|nr:hypothetical protein PpBr36_01821 [Pyricularia pennisetigena]TLS28869.1 hypothetical protein PpBr36_01821 [Pyricularia pennisetigena]